MRGEEFMEEIVFLKGKFLPEKAAKISVLEPGFLYGWGLFETMRAYQGKIVYLEAHLERMRGAVRIMGLNLPYSLAQLKRLMLRIVKLNRLTDAYVRLTLWKSQKGTDILLTAKKYNPFPIQKYRTGFRVCVSSFRKDADSLLARLKCTSRLLYELSFQTAKARGFDEAIILNHRGYIIEASRSNIFLLKNNVLFTPALDCGCLEGITRKVVLDLAKKYKIKIYQGNFSPQDLYGADEAFLTNSLMGVMPLRSVEKRIIAKGAPFKLTGFFMKKYWSLLKGN